MNICDVIAQHAYCVTAVFRIVVFDEESGVKDLYPVPEDCLVLVLVTECFH